MIARLTVAGQEKWHRDVVNCEVDDRYLTLNLAKHPNRVNYWLPRTAILLCATDEDVTAELRAEQNGK